MITIKILQKYKKIINITELCRLSDLDSHNINNKIRNSTELTIIEAIKIAETLTKLKIKLGEEIGNQTR